MEALLLEEKKRPHKDLTRITVPPGCTLLDMIRPVREAVPNATVRLPKRVIDSDLTCAICMNIICETMIISDCLHRFCSDCIGQCLRLSKRECPSCRTAVTRHQLVRDPEFDAIISKMYPDISGLRDLQDVKAAEFCMSDNIKVISEDLKERLEQQVQLTAAGGRSLADSPANLPEDAVDVGRVAPGFMSENAQLRPSHFTRLKTNEYPGEASSTYAEPPECECFYVEGTGGCKSDCSNRKARVQCSPLTCPCGPGCTNLHFRTRLESGDEVTPVSKSVKLGVFNTPRKGWALKSLEEVAQGRMIEEVLGEVLTAAEAASRLVTPKRRAAAKTSASHFLLSIGTDVYLDLTDKSSLSRFVNHSGTPNCELQVWDVLGERRVGLFALKPIRKDAELTVDYATAHVGEKGIENQCETRGGGKTQKDIPFKEYVEEVIAMASRSAVDGQGVSTEEARMVVHEDDDDLHKHSSSVVLKSPTTARARERDTPGFSDKRPKTEANAPPPAAREAGGGGSMSLMERLVADAEKITPVANAAKHSRIVGGGSTGGGGVNPPMLKGNEAMTVGEILEQWGILEPVQAQQLSLYLQQHGVSVQMAVEALFQHVTPQLLDRALNRRNESLQYLASQRGRGAGLNGSVLEGVATPMSAPSSRVGPAVASQALVHNAPPQHVQAYTQPAMSAFQQRHGIDYHHGQQAVMAPPITYAGLAGSGGDRERPNAGWEGGRGGTNSWGPRHSQQNHAPQHQPWNNGVHHQHIQQQPPHMSQAPNSRGTGMIAEPSQHSSWSWYPQDNDRSARNRDRDRERERERESRWSRSPRREWDEREKRWSRSPRREWERERRDPEREREREWERERER